MARRSGRQRGTRWAVTFGLLAALPAVVALAAQAVAGWGANLDEAVIAWRSYDQLAGNGPLVGQLTQASTALGSAVYDPGPALYWVLALPTRLAPARGPLLAAALVATAAMLLACTAALRLGGRLAAGSTALGMLVLVVTLADQLPVMPIWNPYLALLPFAAALVAAVAVTAGRLRWWPLLVALASFAVQCHLVYSAGVALAVLAPVAGVVTVRRAGGRPGRVWAPAGVAVAVVLWAPAVIQQLRGTPGNLGQLVHSTLLDSRPSLGASFGLRELGAAVAENPLPRWLHRPAPWDLADVRAGSVLVALLALGAVAAVTLGPWRHDAVRRALGLVTLVAAGVLVVTLAGLAQVTIFAILYLRYALYPVGMLIWAVLLLAGHDAVGALLRRRPVAAAGWTTRRRTGPALVGTALFAVLSLGLSIWLGSRTPDVRSVLQGDRPRDVAAARALGGLLGRPPARGSRIAVALPDPGGHDGVARQLAVGYQLRTEGWTPSIPDPAISQLLAPVYAARPSDPVLTLGAAAPPGARILGRVEVGGAPMTVSLLDPAGP